MNTIENLTVDQLATKVLSQLESKMTFEQLKAFRTDLGRVIKNHDDYVAPTKKEHLIAKKKALSLILNEVLGLNAAIKTLKKLVNAGKVDISECTTKEVHENQLKFILNKNAGIKQIKFFMSDAMKKQTAFTPNDILTTAIKVGTMKPSNYSKRVADYK